MRKSNAEHEKKRRIVAAGIAAGHPTNRIAQDAKTSQRNVQLIAKEPATQFLITESFAPLHKKLRAMTARAVQVVEQGFSAMRYVKAGKDDYRLRGDAIARLRAVERFGDLLEFAQGKPAEETTGEIGRSYTFEEFTLLRARRVTSAEADPANP
jgi:hypothetical protein